MPLEVSQPLLERPAPGDGVTHSCEAKEGEKRWRPSGGWQPGEFAGDPLDLPQAKAVILKEIKANTDTADLSPGVKAKLAGTIVGQLGSVQEGGEKIAEIITAIDSIRF